MKTLLMSEFIGLMVEVVESKNPALVGIKGKIIDETKNTFRIKTKNNVKTVVKENAKFIINIKDKKIKIDGKIIAKRPEDRLKSKVK